MSRYTIDHFMNRYFDLVQQNRELHSRTLAYQSIQDSYMNTMINMMQAQSGQNNRPSRRQSGSRLFPSVRTAYFDLGTLFNDVVVRPTRQEIAHATRDVSFSDIDEPPNSQCPITQENFAPNDTVTQIRHCGHIFTPDEISTWWERNVRCPVCRYDIREYREETTRAENTTDNESRQDNNTNEETNQETTRPASLNYNNHTTLPRIRTASRITSPRTTFSRNSRSTQLNPDTNISDQELTSYVNLATQLLSSFSQRDISGSVDILYTI